MPPLMAISSGVPISSTRPSRSVTMRSTDEIVESRWAMMRVVRPVMSSSRPACTCRSALVSRELVASSSTRMGASLCSARAIALLLPSGQLEAALADLGVVPVREPVDERLYVGAAGGFLDRVLVGAARVTVRDVLPDGPGEQRRVLEDDPNVLTYSSV